MSIGYIVRRFLIFLAVVWAAATFNFFLPRLGGQNPIREKLVSQAALSGAVQAGLEEMVKEFETKFGLDKPLWQQYLTYLSDMARFDFNYSIANYPRKVTDMMADALPWTVTLLLITTLLGFVIGNILGALLAWPGAPTFLNYLMPPILMLSAIPYFLFGLILVYAFGFYLGVFPMYGGYTTGTIPTLTIGFIWDVIWHSMLPALSILLVSMGGWALGMRSMMVMTQGEDYVIFADAMGLRDRTIFSRYAIPQRLVAPGNRAGSGPGNDRIGRCVGRGDFRLSGHRHHALPGDSRLRLLPRSGHCVRRYRLDRPGNIYPRHHLSAA